MRSMRPFRLARCALVALLLVAGLASCGDDDDDTSSDTTTDASTTDDGAGTDTGDASEDDGAASEDDAADTGDGTTEDGAEDDATDDAADDGTAPEPTGEAQPLPDGEASGDPVKIGLVTDGKGPSNDNTAQIHVAEAMVEFLNGQHAGIGGRPIELVVCETEADVAKAGDCGNQMVADGVIAVVMPEVAQAEATWKVLSESNVPLWYFSSGDLAMTQDGESTFSFAGSIGPLLDVPIALAEEAGLSKVYFMVVDVPAATSTMENFGPDVFDAAGMDFELIRLPFGLPDYTAQVNQVLTGDPGVATVIGTDALCIAAVQGLRAADFPHPIFEIGCDAESAREALGDQLEGLYTLETNQDPDDPEAALIDSIIADYDIELGDDETLILNSIQMWYSLAQILQGLTDFSTEGVIETFMTMPPTPVIAGDGRVLQCGGSINPNLPALCSEGAAYSVLGADGLPTETLVVGAGG